MKNKLQKNNKIATQPTHPKLNFKKSLFLLLNLFSFPHENQCLNPLTPSRHTTTNAEPPVDPSKILLMLTEKERFLSLDEFMVFNNADPDLVANSLNPNPPPKYKEVQNQNNMTLERVFFFIECERSQKAQVLEAFTFLKQLSDWNFLFFPDKLMDYIPHRYQFDG